MNSPDFLWQRGKCTHYAVHLTIVNRNAACLCGTVYVLGCILYLTVSKAPVFLHHTNAPTQIITESMDPAGAASPIGNNVSAKNFEARYEPGTRRQMIAIILWMNPM